MVVEVGVEIVVEVVVGMWSLIFSALSLVLSSLLCLLFYRSMSEVEWEHEEGVVLPSEGDRLCLWRVGTHLIRMGFGLDSLGELATSTASRIRSCVSGKGLSP